MHRILSAEIRWPGADALRSVANEFMYGLRNLAPPRLRNAGWKPAYALRRWDGAQRSDADAIVEKSALGETRITSQSAPDAALPLHLDISSDKVFVVDFELPRAAGRDLESAIRLRMEEVSPLPPDQAVFAYQRLPAPQSDRLRIKIAIVKAKTLETIKSQIATAPIAQIGTAANAAGRFQFIFYENRRYASRAQFQKHANRALRLALACIALVAAFDIHLTRRAEALAAYETELITQLRDLRAPTALFAGPELQQSDSRAGASLHSSLRAVLDAVAQTPDGTIIETARYHDGLSTISGFTPETQRESLASNGYELHASDRPSYWRLQSTTGIEETQ